MQNNALLLIVITVIFALPVCAHPGHSHPASRIIADSNNVAIDSEMSTIKLSDSISLPSTTMGFEEKLGSMVPLDVPFVSDNGDTLPFKKFIQGPTILSILYYKCPNACNTLIASIANVLRAYVDKPENMPNVITMTVDESETVVDARKAKRVALEAFGKNFPQDRWHFLTAQASSINAVTQAVGFHFVKRGDDYDHPLGIIILSPDGKVVRYISGTEYLPVDITMSLMEARTGSIQPTIARVLRSCFSYDPKSHRFVFSILQVSATVIFSLIGIFILYLIVSGRSRNAKKRR